MSKKIDINTLTIVKKLNSGSFGDVYSAKDKETGANYAVKVIKLEDNHKQLKQMINREIGIMSHVDHPTIIKFYGYSMTDFEGNNNVSIVMELAQKGTLADALMNEQNSLADDKYDNTAKQIILIGIARGMMYLHQHQIVHQDLKPGNILLDENLRPHLTDFGLSKFIGNEKNTIHSKACGSIFYMAPEVIKEENFNFKADVYSFGILMYEVISQAVPYPDFQNKKMNEYLFFQKVVNNNYRPEFKYPMKKSIRNLIERCWSEDPKLRPTFEEIFNKLAYNKLDEFIENIFNLDKNEEEDDDNDDDD